MSVSSGGRSPIRSGGRSPILSLEQLAQFLTNSHEHSAEMFALECTCARHILRQWQKEYRHGNFILGQAWGNSTSVANGVPEFGVFTNSHEIWQRCLPWSAKMCMNAFFDSDRKSALPMVTAYYEQKWAGKSCVAKLLNASFSPILMKFGTDVCLDVYMCKTHFRLTVELEQCACHGNGSIMAKIGGNLASRSTSSVFHQFSWNLAQMSAFGV